MKHDDPVDNEKIHALLGRVVAQILQPGEALPLAELIGALYRTGIVSGDPEVRQRCEHAIRLLIRKLD